MPRDYRANRAAAQVELANAWRLVGRDAEQAGAYQAAVEDLQALNDAFPDVPRFREDLATTRTNLSYLLNELGRNDEAGAAAESALAGWDGLLRGPLVHPRYYAGAAATLLARAQVLRGYPKSGIAVRRCVVA